MKIKRFLIYLSFLLLLPLVSADIVGPGIGGVPGSARPQPILYLTIILIINLVVNCALIAILLFSFKKFRRKVKVNYIWRVLVITVIGLIIDTVAFIGDPFGLISFLIRGLIVLVLVGITSYLLVFRRTLESKQAILSSVIFGAISNPIWIYLFLLGF